MLRDQSRPALHSVGTDDDSDSSDSDKRMSKKASGRLDIAKKKEDDIRKSHSKEEIPIKKSGSKGNIAKSPSKAEVAKSPSMTKSGSKSNVSKSPSKPDITKSPTSLAKSPSKGLVDVRFL